MSYFGLSREILVFVLLAKVVKTEVPNFRLPDDGLTCTEFSALIGVKDRRGSVEVE